MDTNEQLNGQEQGQDQSQTHDADPTHIEFLLRSGMEALGLIPEPHVLAQFMQYKDLLLTWNEKMNLTAITEDRDVIIKHFLDSLTVMSCLDKPGAPLRVVDVGTGAGFPGIPFQIMNPQAHVVLLDSLNKRITFLKEAAQELGLPHLTCVHMRAEEAGKQPDYRDAFDICFSRAVARLSVLTEYCLPLVKVGGRFIAMKGPDTVQEIAEAQPAIKALGGKIADVKTVLLPHSEINHTLIVIKKIRQTPPKYPRNAGLITKNPIK